MWIDHHQLFKPITKASFALDFHNVEETDSKSISLALSEPMGPVHIDLPEDVACASQTIKRGAFTWNSL